jgi:hypothetical protein
MATNVIIDGSAMNVLGAEAVGAQVLVSLCGYGAQAPRIQNSGVYAALSLTVTADSTGQYHFEIYSNDQIEPAGTYYTFAYMNANGDIMQVNAYVFDGPGEYDTSILVPFDPTLPLPPLPPLIISQLLIVPYSATPEFPGNVYTAFRIVLTGDVTSSTAPDTLPGNLYTFIIFQDGVGGHEFVWPTNFINASGINPDPNGLTVQTFVMGESALVAIGPATWTN